MDELRELLLRAGISPAAVNRYLGELREHLEDLVAELTATGVSHTVARDLALCRLGNAHQLAAPMLGDPRYRSFARRAPLLVWLGIPLAAMAGLAALFACVVVFAVRNGLPSSRLEGVAQILLSVAPLVIAWAISANAIRRRAALAWPALGIASTITSGAATQIEIDTTAVALSLTAPEWPQLVIYAVLAFAPLVLHRTV